MDFKRKRPVTPPVSTPPAAEPVAQPAPVVSTPQSIEPQTPQSSQVPLDQPTGLTMKPKKRWLKVLLIVVGSIIGLALLLFAAAFIWYQHQLSPVGTNKDVLTNITIESGMSPDAIGELLADEHVIRSSLAFNTYNRIAGTRGSLQAGVYKLSPGESTPEIVEHLTSGSVDTFNITFYPGATLAENRKVLLDAGYEASEIDTALTESYGGPLFAAKPANADLEGLIYGETYAFSAGATVHDIIQRSFNQFENVIAENQLTEAYSQRGLTLYEGVILASIIQRESVGGDEAQIAQVFYTRLSTDMVLGSDVTYQYIADKTGVTRDPGLDSPYNTRRYPGLTPTPIASPGKAALLAVANPAAGDYIYFLSGDDDVTYFAHTYAEHERNIVDHCQKKCSVN